jgi:hypothetical protein
MSDDWRLRIDLHDQEHGGALSDRLTASRLEHDLETSFQDRVTVSRDGSEVFCYTGTREQAEKAEQLIRSLADEHGWELDTELTHWHPTEEEWEDPDKAPDGAAEHRALIAKERQEAEQRGYPEFEVRVEFPSHRDAVRFAEKLGEEGNPSVRRWRYLMIGAVDEDSANALAERVRREAPAGAVVSVEGTLQAVAAEQPSNPFAVFGGLAG